MRIRQPVFDTSITVARCGLAGTRQIVDMPDSIRSCARRSRGSLAAGGWSVGSVASLRCMLSVMMVASVAAWLVTLDEVIEDRRM